MTLFKQQFYALAGRHRRLRSKKLLYQWEYYKMGLIY
jgi:hypothetical protein